MGNHGVGIDALAASLGVSKSTVSRALNDYPDIAVATKQRIREAARKTGYHASSLARRLKRGRLETVGIVLSDVGQGLTNPHLAAFLTGMARSLDRSGLDLLVATPPSPEAWRSVYDRLIETRKVDAFVLIRTEAEDPRIDHLRQRGAAFVCHGRTARGGPFAWVDVDNEAAAAQAVAHLAALGHRRIGHIAAPGNYNFARQRQAGFLAGLDAEDLAADPALLVEAALEIEAGEAAALGLMALETPPTALVCATDVQALGAMRGLRALGLAVGRDVSVIGYDDVPMAALAEPALTTFDQESAATGAQLASLLTRLLAGEPAHSLRVLRQARLIRRASDGPPALHPQALRRRLDATGATQSPQRRTA